MTMKDLLKKIYYTYYIRIFPNYQTELKKYIGKCKKFT